MLTCHKELCIPPEAGFALWLAPDFGDWQPGDTRTGQFLDALFNTRKFETWNVTREEVETGLGAQKPANYAELAAAVYRTYADKFQPGWQRWGDKNNFYLERIRDIHALYPDAQFVHIVRDPRDVACSYLEANRNRAADASRYAPDLPDSADAIGHSWRSNIGKIEAAFSHLSDSLVYRIRFEDLVRDVRPALESLCDFLELEFDENMVNYHQLNKKRSLEPAEFLAWKQHTLSPPRLDRIARYRHELEAEQIAQIERITQTQLVEYGYPLH